MKAVILALAVLGATAVSIRKPDETAPLRLNQESETPVNMVDNAQAFLSPNMLNPSSDIVKMHDKAQIAKLKEEGKISEGFPSLTFVHIPKTGGSAIKKASTSIYPYGWGMETNLALNTMIPKDKKGPNHCFVEQLPPKEITSIYGEKVSQEMYEKRQTFCTVRNPAERVVAEYLSLNKPCDEKELNNWVTEELTAFQKGDYLRNQCFFIPQVDYMEGPGACMHQLDADNLENDFNQLMKQHGFNLKLPKEEKKASTCKLTGKDLKEKTQRLVEVVYQRDFEELGPKFGWSEESLGDKIKNFILAPINALTNV